MTSARAAIFNKWSRGESNPRPLECDPTSSGPECPRMSTNDPEKRHFMQLLVDTGGQENSPSLAPGLVPRRPLEFLSPDRREALQDEASRLVVDLLIRVGYASGNSIPVRSGRPRVLNRGRLRGRAAAA